ncbi:MULTISPECIES: TetR/AcrR family transcriptional regulator [Caulobacter]|jgi:AcrR family transcriptional regulator|uniref:Transcriptional regulator, TetR family n=1 Tax=Caulobacter vibrioides OR37 TaxID=1292034 RepID=R0EEP3_CAUVI|nr:MULTISPECIES: TetR/AcrR family transcriptional regulator [Caulobacter]ENZ83903.1 transcriptional regulator, TetR family [Caulobacter vibrioides OR37]
MDIKPRKDRDSRREAILDIAAELFLNEGFEATSMSTIAARVGGSKSTLYNYFKSKEEIFQAHVERYCNWQSEEMFHLLDDEGDDVSAALTRIGRRYVTNVMSDRNMRHFRLIVSAAERSPELGKAFYEAGPLRGARLLGGFLARMRDKGLIDAADPLSAAHQFIGLCQNRMLKSRLVGHSSEPTRQEVDAEVDAAVRTFVAAFAPRAAP